MPPSLAELVAPGRCALILQEVQEGVVGTGSALPELAAAAWEVGLDKALRALTAGARSVGVPVLHCTAADMPGRFGANRNARLFTAARRSGTLAEAGDVRVAPLTGLLGPGDLLIPRFQGLSPLTGAQMDSLLRNEGITTLIVTGVSLNMAIPNLVFDAVNRSYEVVVITDAVAGTPVEYGRQVVEHTLRPLATLATAADVGMAWAGNR